MKLIKNAICYRMTLPVLPLLEGHLSELRHTEIHEAEREKVGFVPTEIPGAVTGDQLTEPFEGGLAFTLRIDEKIIPAAVISAEVKRRCAE